MTARERAIAALELRQPDQVPTFELEFQLAEEMFGKPFVPAALRPEALARMGAKEKETALYEAAVYMAQVYETLEYAIIPAYGPGDDGSVWREGRVNDDMRLFLRILRELSGKRAMLAYHGDGTFAIPDGEQMMEFAYRLADEPEAVKAEAEAMANQAIERNKRLQEAGIECLLLCSDYCYNSGPFLSPAMFGEFIQPYLARIIEAARRDGLYTIKHTDGNIMPILNQLVECRPHALHSIDPMAGVDIREVKRLVGDRVCLCGNVHCAAMQTGTEQDVIDSATYCLTHGKPGGGYIYCTSNVPFKGLKPERYQLVLDVWRKHRDYRV